MINREMVILVHHYLKWSLGSTINRNTDSLQSVSLMVKGSFESVENNFYKPTALKSPLKTCQLPNPKSPWLHLKQQLLVTDGLTDANINSIDTEADI